MQSTVFDMTQMTTKTAADTRADAPPSTVKIREVSDHLKPPRKVVTTHEFPSTDGSHTARYVVSREFRLAVPSMGWIEISTDDSGSAKIVNQQVSARAIIDLILETWLDWGASLTRENTSADAATLKQHLDVLEREFVEGLKALPDTDWTKLSALEAAELEQKTNPSVMNTSFKYHHPANPISRIQVAWSIMPAVPNFDEECVAREQRRAIDKASEGEE